MYSEPQIRTALENPESSATLLHAIVFRRYGEEWYNWDPVTIALELKDDFSLDIPAANLDKLCAIQVLMTTAAFFEELDAFLAICGTFAEGDPLFDVFDPASVEEVVWGVTEAAINRELLPFSRAIKLHVRQLLREDGYGPADYPPAIAELLETDPDSEDITQGLASMANSENASAYVRDQLNDFVDQFRRVPSLSGLELKILDKGFSDAIEEAHR